MGTSGYYNSATNVRAALYYVLIVHGVKSPANAHTTPSANTLFTNEPMSTHTRCRHRARTEPGLGGVKHPRTRTANSGATTAHGTHHRPVCLRRPKTTVSRLPSDDAVKALRHCGECSRHPFCCKSLPGSTVHGNFGSRKFGRRDDGDAPIFSCLFFPELLWPTTRAATTDGATLRLLRHRLLSLRDHLQCMGGLGH